MMAGAHPNMANPGTPRTHTNNTNTNQLQPQGSMGGLNMAGGLAGAAVATPTMQGQGGSTPKRARLLTSFSLAAPGAAGMAAPQTAACAAGMSGQGGGAASGVMIGPNGAPLLSSQSLPTSLAPMGPGGFPLGKAYLRHTHTHTHTHNSPRPRLAALPRTRALFPMLQAGFTVA